MFGLGEKSNNKYLGGLGINGSTRVHIQRKSYWSQQDSTNDGSYFKKTIRMVVIQKYNSKPNKQCK